MSGHDFSRAVSDAKLMWALARGGTDFLRRRLFSQPL